MTAEELLKQMSVEPFAEEMVCCVIDPETRVIDVPAEYQLLGVESDEKVERMYFRRLSETILTCPNWLCVSISGTQTIRKINTLWMM